MDDISENQKILNIIGSKPLASDIHKSIAVALESSFVHIIGSETVWDVFKLSLDASIRDIEEHPRGKLFRRLIEFGPLNSNNPKALVCDGETVLSDAECGSCLEFIFSHMINRFKGELAELLALEPCTILFQKLQQEGRLPLGIEYYWGDIIQERRRPEKLSREFNIRWGSFTKGADGLLVEQIDVKHDKNYNLLKIHSVVEVKSMIRSKRKVINQINNHIFRLGGGVKLNEKEYSSNFISKSNSLIKVMVKPSSWKLSRKWQSVKKDDKRAIILPELSESPIKTQVEELESNLWQVKLGLPSKFGTILI